MNITISHINNQEALNTFIQRYPSMGEYRNEICYRDLSKDTKIDDGMVVGYDENNKIVLIAFVKYNEDAKCNVVCIPYSNYDENANVIKAISQEYPNSIFYQECGFDEVATGMHYLNNISSINPNEEYCFHGWWTNGLSENYLRDLFEKRYVAMPYESFSLADVIFEVHPIEEVHHMPLEEMSPFVYGAYGILDNGFAHRAGFHYFDFKDNNNGISSNVIFAINKRTHKILGVIKYGFWKNYPNTLCIDYVDVSYGARHHGIATAMIKFLDIVKGDVSKLRIGYLSDMGQEYHIDEIFKNNIHNVEFVAR